MRQWVPAQWEVYLMRRPDIGGPVVDLHVMTSITRPGDKTTRARQRRGGSRCSCRSNRCTRPVERGLVPRVLPSTPDRAHVGMFESKSKPHFLENAILPAEFHALQAHLACLEEPPFASPTKSKSPRHRHRRPAHVSHRHSTLIYTGSSPLPLTVPSNPHLICLTRRFIRFRLHR